MSMIQSRHAMLACSANLAGDGAVASINIDDLAGDILRAITG